jgi:hypothetical protein
MCGKIKRTAGVPASRLPMRSIDGHTASHALPGTPLQRDVVESGLNAK